MLVYTNSIRTRKKVFYYVIYCFSASVECFYFHFNEKFWCTTHILFFGYSYTSSDENELSQEYEKKVEQKGMFHFTAHAVTYSLLQKLSRLHSFE